MTKTSFLILSLWFLFQPYYGSAQFENTGKITNNGGFIDNYPMWNNLASGTYIGSNNGTFNHSGPKTLTFINHGSYSGNLGHTDVFMGPNGANGEQEIGGTKRPQFFNLKFNNGSESSINVINTKGIGIDGKLDLQNGITTTSRQLHHTAAIVFGTNATYSNGNTDTQHVNGYVSKIGNTPFTFPVGSGLDIRTLSIANAESVSSEFSTAWIPGDPSTTEDPSDVNKYHLISLFSSELNAISNVGQWDWLKSGEPSGDVQITVSIPDVSDFATSDKLRLAGWNGNQWVDLSHAPAASGVTENSTLVGTISDGFQITAIGIGSAPPSLPVRLLSFEAKGVEKTNVLLTWTTADEVNNDYFLVQHSLNSKNFATVGEIKALGAATNENTTYSFTHKVSSSLGNHYYRLKQVDLDGSFAYSKIENVKFEDALAPIYPNPTSDFINVEIVDWDSITSLELFDSKGKKFFETREKMPHFRIGTIGLIPGIYTVRLNFINGDHLARKIAISK